MGDRTAMAVLATASAILLMPLGLRAGQAGPPVEADRPAVVRAMLDRSRLLQDTYFQIPADLYRQYLRDRNGPDGPVDFIAEEGFYHLTVDADRKGLLEAKVRLRVFDPAKVRGVPVLTDALAWERVAVNGKEARLATSGRSLAFTAEAPGVYTIEAKVSLKATPATGGRLAIPVVRTVRTALAFDSPGAWEVRAQRRAENLPNGLTRSVKPKAVAADEFVAELHGEAARGTHGRLALLPTTGLVAEFHPPQPQREHPARYEVRGDVNWNLDAGAQQVRALLKVTIAGGASDRIELNLPPRADRVKITGPDVREVNVAGGRAAVYLRGKILGQTALDVACELPAGSGSECAMGELGVSEGHWAGGTLVVTNSVGGSEVLPGTMSGLRELAMSEVPASARAILPAPAVLAYEIVSRNFTAGVEVLQLGEFALRQSIADLAHYELFLDNDGSAIGRVRYEIRNRTRQFLTLRLPAGARILLARVNEKSCPITEIAPGRWLLPLERSAASVMGLVSFPVEAVFTFRMRAPGAAGAAEIPLPAIDLPVAYGWCEAYLPEAMTIRQWAGVLRPVEQFSSETAKNSLDYGMSQLAQGYTEKSRPTATGQKTAAVLRHEIAAKPAETVKSVDEGRTVEAAKSVQPKSDSSFIPTKTGKGSLQLLGKNSYRAGKDLYDKGDYEAAAANLKKAAQLAQGSVEGENAGKLLANIDTLQGKVEAKGKSQKAAALEVQKQAAEQNRSLEVEQEKLVEQALEDVKAGRRLDARNRLEAAQAMQSKLMLVKGGAGSLALDKKADKQLEDLRKESQQQAATGLRAVRQLKEEKRYDEALALATRIRDQEGDKQEELQKEMESLAVASVRERKPQSAAGAEFNMNDDFAREGGGRALSLARRLPATPAAEPAPGPAPAKPMPDGSSRPTTAPTIMLDMDIRTGGDANRIVRDRLETKIEKLNFTDNDLDVVLGFMRDVSGVSFQVDWNSMNTAGIDKNKKISVQINNVTLDQALKAILERVGGETAKVVYVMGDGAITITTADSPLARKAFAKKAPVQPAVPNRVARTYDVRDLVAATQPNVSGESADGLAKLVKETVAADSWRSGGDIRLGDGMLVVTQTEDNQRAVGELLEKLRQARGPQVEVGGRIAQQRASGANAYSGNVTVNGSGMLTLSGANTFTGTTTVNAPAITLNNGQNVYTGGTTITGGTLQLGNSGNAASQNDLSGNRELKDFLDRNYGWQSEGGRYNNAWGYNDPATTGGFVYSDADRPSDMPVSGVQGGGNERDRAALANKLNYNLGQKVVVNSMNLAANREDAASLGVNFTAGANGAVFGVMDEAQFRSLMELDAARKRSGAIVYDNKRLQETIVGTDARLANGTVANVRFAGENRNDLDYYGNAVSLPHQEYLVTDNGGYLTVVRAGAMQFWNEKPADVEFAEVPQFIEVPRVGQAVRLEKVLIPEQSDCLMIRVDYSWKGTSK